MLESNPAVRDYREIHIEPAQPLVVTLQFQHRPYHPLLFLV